MLSPQERIGVWFNSEGVTVLPSSPSRIKYQPEGLGNVSFHVGVVDMSTLTAMPVPELDRVFAVIKVRDAG